MGIHWLVIITLIIIFVQANIYKRVGLSKVSYKRMFNVSEAFVGDRVHMVEVIANRKLLPLPWLRLESMISAGLRFESQDDLNISAGDQFQNHRSLFSLAPYTEIVRRHNVLCAKRGAYELRSATMTCGDLFNIHTKTEQLTLDTSLLVFPEIIDFDDLAIPSHSWQGDMVVRRWIVNDPFMIAGAREYRAGDPLNYINWKATARTGDLQVHQHDFTANQRLMVVLNFDVTEEMWTTVTNPELIEYGISIAASIAARTISIGLETGFACNGYTIDHPKEKLPVMIRPGLGQDHLTYIYEEMAKLLIARSSDFPTFMERELLNQPVETTDYLFITAFVSEKMHDYINQLRQQGHAVAILTLQDEKGEEANGTDHSEKMVAGAS